MQNLLKPLLCFTLLFSLIFSTSFATAKSNELTKEEQIEIIKEKLNTGKNLSSFDARLDKKLSNKSILKNSFQKEVKASGNLYLTSIDPTDWQKNVPRNKIITLRLNTNIQFGSGSISVWSWKTLDDFPIKASIVGNTLYIYPQGNLESNHQYMVDLSADAIRTSDGKTANAKYYYTFITGDYVTPMITTTSPAYGDLKASTSGKMTFTYDKTIKLEDAKKILMLDGKGKEVSFTASVSGKSLTVTTNEKLKSNEYYAIGVFSGAVSDSSNIYNQDYILAFKTGNSNDDGGSTPSDLSITLVKGVTNKIKLSGGSAPYSASSSDSKVVSASVKSTNLELKGLKAGSATVTVKDRNGTEININVQVIDDTLKF